MTAEVLFGAMDSWTAPRASFQSGFCIRKARVSEEDSEMRPFRLSMLYPSANGNQDLKRLFFSSRRSY